MSTEETLKLIATLLPLTTQIMIKGQQITTIFKEDMTTEELLEALTKSKSSNWPDLNFGQ